MFAFELMKNQPLSATNRGLRRNSGILEDSDFGIINKKEINNIMNEFDTTPAPQKKKQTRSNRLDMSNKPIDCPLGYDPIAYEMSSVLADNLIKNAKGNYTRAQEILCDYVNRERCLKGYCVRVQVI